MFKQSEQQRAFNQADVARQLSAWYAGKSGTRPAQILDALMHEWLSEDFGQSALELAGLPHHADWMQSGKFKSRFRIGPTEADAVADFEALPIETESLDLVVACHALEFVEDPYRLLREIDRVLIPEGRCIIVVFNPLGLPGLARPFRLFRGAPWCGHFYSLPRIREWLSVLGFSIEKSGWFAPPFVVAGDRWWQQSADFALTKGLFWMGSLAALYTRKRVSRMIPLGAKWHRRSFLESKATQPAAFTPHHVIFSNRDLYRRRVPGQPGTRRLGRTAGV